MKLNRFLKVSFDCDKCGGEFYRDIVFSPAPNLRRLSYYSHYCFDCAEVIKKRTSSKKTRKTPIRQQNRRKKTGRTHLFGTRATKE
jgi:hypothetical protein